MLPTDYQNFIATSRYARWLEDDKRRETWAETVNRYMENIIKPHILHAKMRNTIENKILNLEVMPSMRALMVAGESSERDTEAR